MERSRENAHSFFHARRHANTRSHLINARTLRKRQYLRSETVRTQPNLHVPSVLVVQVLWLPCHKTIYEISSSLIRLPNVGEVGTGARIAGVLIYASKVNSWLSDGTERREVRINARLISVKI